jgi:hypothetical protein
MTAASTNNDTQHLTNREQRVFMALGVFFLSPVLFLSIIFILKVNAG